MMIACLYRTARFIVFASATLPSQAVAAFGGDTSYANDRKLDYRELAKGLVSPNKPCKCEIGGTEVQFPPGYDAAAQDRIEKNRQTLYEHCEDALPALTEGCTDSRYSMTWRSDSYCGNMCVGEVCLEIIADRLEAYRRYMSLGTKEDYWGFRFVPRLHGAIGDDVTDARKKEIEDWWRGRKGKTLVELQIEAFDWAISKRTEQDKRSRPANGGKSVFGEEIDRTVAARDKIRKEGKCLPPAQDLAPVAFIPKSLRHAKP
jgi:hypothetical protein